MKKTASVLLLAASIMITCGPAQADPVMECSWQTSSQVETAECLENVGKGVATALETSLGFAMTAARELDTETGRASAVPALEAAQAAWSDFRQKHCDFVGSTYGGGSGTGIAIRGCRIELGRARVDVLMK